MFVFAAAIIMSNLKPLAFYIGTYTSAGGSKGIYYAYLDSVTGAISEPELAAETGSPSFIAVHPNGKFIYSVDESSNGKASAFAIGQDHKLRFIDSQTAPGAGPCHISVDPGGRSLFTASYGGGALASFPLKPDGSIGPHAYSLKNSGHGPNTARQEASHLHSIYADAKSRHVYACDLGTDEVLAFTLNPATAKLTPTPTKSYRVPAGGGPRHLAFHPSGGFLVVNNEMLSSVTSFAIEADNGVLHPLGTVSTLPAGKVMAENSTAEIAFSPNGRFVYVSNRGHDSIAVFSCDNNGRLSPIEVVPAGVKVPRGFGIDPTGNWLVVAGQNSHDLTAFRLNPGTGRLKPTGQKVSLKSPVCIAFTKG